ncbi:MAG TPA: SIMPL domain-containing protein [Acidimicrobiia bacterium]
MSPVETGITVTGTGDFVTAPDVMTVDIGVSLRADTIAEASSGARERANTLIESLTGSGVDRKDIVTTNYSIFPEYDHQDGAQRLLGFRVSNDMKVTVRDLGGAGDLIDGAVTAVGDAVTVNQVSFGVDDDQTARTRAREMAWSEAKAKAEHLAQLTGRVLGKVVSIEETPGYGPGPRPMARMAAMAESTPIESGTSIVSVTLEVRFELD